MTAAEQAVCPDGLPGSRRIWSALAIWLGIAVSVLDSSVANVALPSIAHQLHARPADSTWVLNAYQIGVVVTLLPLAALGERIGYRRVYLSGLALFTLASLGCALSGSLGALIGWRLVQGLGASGISAVNGALVRFTYPQSRLGRGLGLNALVVASAGALGPTIASAILAVANWHWLFAVNVPICLFNLALAYRALPYSERTETRLDWVSGGLSAVAFSVVFLGVDTLRTRTGLGAAEIAAALALAALLIRREAGVPRPLIPIDLMRIPVFALSVSASVCAFAAYNLAFTALPFYFEQALGRNQVQTGLLITPWPAALAVVAPLAGRISDRVPAGLLGGIGLLVLAAGLALMATLGRQSSDLDIVWRMAICGVGFGLFQSPNNRTMMTAAPRDRSGAAGGMLATARLTGMITGTALVAAIFGLAGRNAEPVDLSIAAGLAIVAAVASVARLGSPQGRTATRPQNPSRGPST